MLERYPVETYTNFGEILIDDIMAVGENLQATLEGAAGPWSVRYTEIDDYDRMCDAVKAVDGEIDYSRFAQHLQLYRPGTDPQTTIDKVPPLALLKLPIEGGRFAVGDSSLTAVLHEQGRFGPVFDGVHGLLSVNRGVQIYLGGDGRAEVFMGSSGGSIDLVHINLI